MVRSHREQADLIGDGQVSQRTGSLTGDGQPGAVIWGGQV